MRFVALVSGLFVAFFSFTTAQALTLKSIDIKESTADLRLHFQGDKRLSYKAFNLDNPPRFVIDFANMRRPKLSMQTLKRGTHKVKNIRSSESPKKFRLVFDLDHAYVFDQRVGKTGQEVMISLHKPILNHKTVQHKASTKTKINMPLPKATKKSVMQNRVDRMKKRRMIPRDHLLTKPYRPIVVVIDPGHGGKDPGASGGRHYKEKDIVLSIAKRLANELNHRFGFRAILTRSSDKYISLRERLNLARHYNADMFVSIHADAYKNNRARGASVFALSERGATSEAAHWLAERENSSELMGGVKLDGKGAILRSVLIDLSQTATTGASLEIGAEVLSELKGVTRLHKGKVEQAAFVVLKSPDIPSLLVETGFVSNQREVARLASAPYQKQLAKAISKGIEQYFVRRPLRGTILDATKRGVLKHVVVRGDNLSLIAKRYQTSVSEIKRANSLKNNVLHVGQVLLMPQKSLPV